MLSRPWKHPKTGVYYFRLSIPEDLRPYAQGGKEEPSREYKRSLHTKDPRTAKRLHPDVAARCDEYLSELRARKAKATNGAHNAAPATPSTGEVAAELSREALAALAAELAHQVLTTHASNPGPDQAFKLNNAFPPGPWGTRADPWAGQRFLLIIGRRDRWQPASAQESVSEPARSFLQARGVGLTAADWETFCELARDALDAAYETLQRRYRGDLSDAPLRERFPLAAVPASRPKVSLKGLVEVWAKVRSATKSRSLKKYTRRLRELSEFLKHDDALAVESKDLRRWRDHLKSLGRSAKTINDDCVGVVLTVFRAAAREEIIPSYPFEGGGFTIKEDSGKSKRRPYEDGEAAQVLSAARREDAAALRWLPWVMAYTGARVGEVAQLRREDVKAREGIPFVAITDQGEEQSTKTESSVRDVPVHPALQREGFLKFVETVPHGSFLFGDLSGKTQEQRADSGSRVYMRWLRKTVGITDKRVVGHSWRHRIEDELREVDAPDEVARAITGRTREGSRALYGKGPSLKTKARWLAKVPAVKLARRAGS
jgi:integrase